MTHPPAGDDLLTTGQAAEILGTTARHVVNLCLRGELPYTLAGTHRRVRRADVTAFAARAAANRGGPLTDDQLAAEPDRSLETARTAVERLLARDPDGARWLRAWLDLIDRGPEAVMRTMTSTDPLARELRQNSPFLALLGTDERRAILASFRAARAAGTIGR
jgi:excisionase family DNA binding protein